MDDDSNFPPIASPHGGHNTPAKQAGRLNEAHLSVEVLLTDGQAWRYAYTEFLQPRSIFGVFGLGLFFCSEFLPFGRRLLPLLGGLCVCLLLSLSVCLLCSATYHLFTNRFYEIELGRYGVYKRNEHNETLFRWHSVLWFWKINGDVWIVTSLGGLFIPREAFGSRELAHDFVVLARKSWRGEFDRI